MKNRLLLLSSVLLVLVTFGACRSDEADTPPPTMKPSEPARAAEKKDPTPGGSADEIALKSGLTVVIRPLLRGLPTSDRYNLELTSWQLGPASVAYKGPERMTGSVTVSEQLRENGRGFAAPFFWGTGADMTATGPIIWLSSTSFRELQSGGQTTIVPTGLAGGKTLTIGTSTQPIGLRKTGTGTHSLSMLGRPLSVPVLLAEDDSGTSYSILDTPANPLVVSVRYGAKSTVGGSALPDSLTAGSGYDVIGVELPTKDAPKRPSESFGQPSRSGPPAGGAK